MEISKSHLVERSLSHKDSKFVFSTSPTEITHFDSLAQVLTNISYGAGVQNMQLTIQRRDSEHFQIVVQIKDLDTKNIVYDNLNAEEFDSPVEEEINAD